MFVARRCNRLEKSSLIKRKKNSHSGRDERTKGNEILTFSTGRAKERRASAFRSWAHTFLCGENLHQNIADDHTLERQSWRCKDSPSSACGDITMFQALFGPVIPLVSDIRQIFSVSSCWINTVISHAETDLDWYVNAEHTASAITTLRVVTKHNDLPWLSHIRVTHRHLDIFDGLFKVQLVFIVMCSMTSTMVISDFSLERWEWERAW